MSFKLRMISTLTLIFPLYASAALVQYESSAELQAVIGPTVVEDFGPQPDHPLGIYLSGALHHQTNENGIVPGDIVPGVVFFSAVPDNTDCYMCITYTANFDGGVLYSWEALGDRALNVVFLDPALGFGFVTDNNMQTGFTLVSRHESGRVEYMGVELSPYLDRDDTQYFGFSSTDDPIKSISIKTTAGASSNYLIDDFEFAPVAAPVPLPAAFWLLLSGLLPMLAGLRTRENPALK